MRRDAGAKAASALAARRRAALRKAARAEKVDALLVSRPVDVRYLTGFTGEDSFALLGRAWTVLITDGRYAEQAAAQCAGVEVHVRKGKVSAAVAGYVRSHAVGRMAIQADHATVGFRAELAGAVGARRVRPVEGVMLALRAVKDAGEVRTIRRAVRTAVAAMRELLSRGSAGLVGRTETDLAAELDFLMRRRGAEAPSFPTIVAAGAHASLPHYQPGRARVRAGQGVLFDWGARVDGYCSDLTRVVFTGRIPPEIGPVYEVVRRAQRAGIRAAQAGAAACSADAAARAVIEQAGYGERFSHGLGHGIGLQVHEQPLLARRRRRRLRAGMVVTVEPGIYLPGVGGVRIEDDVLVTPDGPRVLSRLPSSRAAAILPVRPRRPREKPWTSERSGSSSS